MKRIYLLVLLSVGFSNIRSQSFNWANKAGLYAYDYGYGIANDNSGNVYVAGKYEDNGANFGGSTVTCQGNHDMFLAKYTSSGSLTWVRHGGGLNGDYAQGMACDPANAVYVVGETEYNNGNPIVFSNSSITLNNVGDNDAFVAKYDLNGNLLWARSAGGFNSDKALAVTYDASGNVYICGFFETTATFGGSTNVNSNGGKDIYIAKYDVNGNFIWVRSAGSAGRDEPKGIKCDAAGNVYMCGFYSNNATMGSQNLTTVSGAYYDSFLAKYDSNGNLIWVETEGGNFDEVAWGLVIDNAGMIYIAGEFNASAYFGTTQLITSGSADIFVACYNSAGAVQWAKKAGGPLLDRARGLGTDGTKLLITGQFGGTANFGSNTLIASDSSDVYFASLDNAGNFLAAAAVGGAPDAYEPLGYESGIAITADASGNTYATGGLLDGGIFGSTVLNAYSRTDVFITSISTMVNVNEITANPETIVAYPNPSSGNVTLHLGKDFNKNVNVCITNCVGQVVNQSSLSKDTETSFDLSTQESGIYFIELKFDNKETIRKKIVLQK